MAAVNVFQASFAIIDWSLFSKDRNGWSSPHINETK